jgi:hypothetical protein
MNKNIKILSLFLVGVKSRKCGFTDFMVLENNGKEICRNFAP